MITKRPTKKIIELKQGQRLRNKSKLKNVAIGIQSAKLNSLNMRQDHIKCYYNSEKGQRNLNLTKLFETQAKLDEHIMQEHPELRGQNNLDWKLLALQVELGEFLKHSVQ